MNYITQRFKNGYDEARGPGGERRKPLACFLVAAFSSLRYPQKELQKRLIEPEDDEEAARRATLAKQPPGSSRAKSSCKKCGKSLLGTWQQRHGKYGNQVGELLSRSKQGSQLYYEAQLDSFTHRFEGRPEARCLSLRVERHDSEAGRSSGRAWTTQSRHLIFEHVRAKRCVSTASAAWTGLVVPRNTMVSLKTLRDMSSSSSTDSGFWIVVLFSIPRVTSQGKEANDLCLFLHHRPGQGRHRLR